MLYTNEQINLINFKKVASPGTRYYEDNGNIWLGKSTKTLILLNQETLPKSDGGYLTNITTQAFLIGIINSSNAIFTSPTNFIPTDVRIFVNGLRQTIITDYQLSNNNIVTFTFSPKIGEILIIEY